MLAVTMALFAWLLVRTTRAELMRQLGDAVVGAAARDAPFHRNPNQEQPAVGQIPVGPIGVSMNGGRRVARLLFAPSGELLNYEPSGFGDNPDPIVSIPAIASAEQREMIDNLVIRPSSNGEIRYLVMARAVRNGRVRFDAVSMESTDSAVRRLTAIALFGGLLATFVAFIATAITMRRTLRPVEEMVATSEKIASGDLSARLPQQKRGSEIGRLGNALNVMLATIENAIGSRDHKERELRQFVADASHELRTPITVVQGYSDLYRSGALAEKSQLDTAMNRIDSQTERMSRLVTDLLLLANLERPEFIARSVVDVAEIATESIYEFLLLEKGHPTTLRSSGPAYAHVDSQRIRQVFDNLLRNVREHTNLGTRVAVEIIPTDATLTINFQNSGPGIDAESCEKMFHRFWRADRTKGQASGASGLGLAITESIVIAHGGTIKVRSCDSEGTTFTIKLPTEISLA
jgi:two-component system, OmpR family, sensor kinase